MPLRNLENQMGLKLNATNHLLIYADDVNLLGDNTDIIKKNTKILIDASKDDGLEINVHKTKYILLFRRQTTGESNYIKTENRSFKNLSQFKYLGMAVISQNLIEEKIETKFNSRNACYHSVQNLSCSRML
jgi:hypothetical protein